MNEETINSVRKKYLAIKPFLNERSRRLWAAVEAISLVMVERLWFPLQLTCLEQQCIGV
jgi:hypothetical protein